MEEEAVLVEHRVIISGAALCGFERGSGAGGQLLEQRAEILTAE